MSGITLRAMWELAVIASALNSCRAPSIRDGSVQECIPGQLELQEAAARPVPSGFHVRQAAMAPDGSILVWGPQAVLLVVGRSGALDSIQLPSQTSVAAARWLPHGALTVLDRWSWSALVIDSSGHIVRRVRYPQLQDGRVTSVDASDEGWVVGVVDPGIRRFSIHHLTHGGEARLVATIAIPEQHRERPNLLVRRTASAVVVMTPAPPFHAWAVDDQGGVVPFEPLRTSDLPTTQSAAPGGQWRALAALEVNCSFVVSLADLASDDRAFAVFARNGSLLRISRLVAPVGLIAASDARDVIAFRRASRPEVVLYRW